MYISDTVVYFEMHKTGCTHIRNLLVEFDHGVLDGKHNRANAKDTFDQPIIATSIRNPWDWYVSLWAFGCMGKGELAHALKNGSSQITTDVAKILGKKVLGRRSAPITIGGETWKSLYDDVNNIGNFQLWLKLLWLGSYP